MDKVRLGIVGYGNMGMPVSNWLIKEGHCPEIDVTAICDWDADRIDCRESSSKKSRFKKTIQKAI